MKVLDKGFVELIEVFGDEVTVVNAARASFEKEIKEFSEQDIKFLRFLFRNKHYSPFRHVQVRLKLKLPEFVARQLYKHVVGIETTSSSVTKDHAFSELSRRYIPINDFYFPEKWRKQSKSNKQGSLLDQKGNNVFLSDDDAILCDKEFEYAMEIVTETIKGLIAKGVAKEQAQILLPLNFYTTIVWTLSFQAIWNLLDLRQAKDAQWETRQYANAIDELVTEKLPVLMSVYKEEKRKQEEDQSLVCLIKSRLNHEGHGHCAKVKSFFLDLLLSSKKKEDIQSYFSKVKGYFIKNN